MSNTDPFSLCILKQNPQELLKKSIYSCPLNYGFGE